MNTSEMARELERLNFEDYIWLFYGSLIFINIIGNYYEKEYVKTQDKINDIKANSIFEMVFILIFLVYLYLLYRNYHNYQKAPDNKKNVYLVRVIGTVFLIIGILCFIYYQDEQRRS